MTARRAAVWVLTCDAPDCHARAIPDPNSPDVHQNQYSLNLAVRVDAFAAGRAAGWVTDRAKHKDYCATHAGWTAAPAPAVVDVPLPDAP